MRIVRWAAGERVDLPDLTAMSFLPLGEFRRMARTVLTGEAMYILNGFAVVAEGGTKRVKVELQPGGEDRGSALGAEALTAGLDRGQLIGDRDSSFINEGQSLQFLDFNGQPNGSYTVELRFTYADGIADNRAFWNSGTSTEFVQITNTRRVSGWQIRFVSGAPTGNEWIPLATVAYVGANIVSGDITDLRDFFFEGTSPFTRATQSAAGAVPDFDRTGTRHASANGIFRLRNAVRALMRQVQDLKGPSDGGVFDWFSRIYKPLDPDASLNAQVTKTLRSVDTVTYTIGDGTKTFGDFNGASGLDDCLAHVAAITDANRPERIEIVVHGGVLYTISDNYTINSGSGDPITVIIRSGVTHNQSNTGLFGRPAIQVQGGNLNASEYALSVIGTSTQIGNLVLKGLDVTWTGSTASGRGMFSADGYITAEDCNLQMANSGSSPAADAGHVLRSSFVQKCVVKNCFILGRMQFYFINSGGVGDEREGGLISNCRIEEAQLLLHSDSPGGGNSDVVQGFTIRDTYWQGRASAIYTGTVAMLQCQGTERLSIDRCTFNYGLNENCIDGRAGALGALPYRWQIRDSTFSTSVSNGAAHANAAGSGGAAGTGWAISVVGGREIQIHDLGMTSISSVDAGGIVLNEITRYAVTGVRYTICSHTAGGSDIFRGLWLTGSTNGCYIGDVSDLSFSEWSGTQTQLRCVDVNMASRLQIHDSKFTGYTTGFAASVDPAANYSVLRIASSENLDIHDCVFEGWNRNTTNARTITFEGSPDSVNISTCMFLDVGGFGIKRASGNPSTVSVDNCTAVRSVAYNTGGGLCDVQSCTLVRVTSNSIDFIDGTVTDAIVITGATTFLVMANRTPNGDIKKVGAGAGRGYNEVGQDLNLVNAYT